ncbi:hypothetical protein Cni_G14563 [Canna indica]|uniref:Uncharacterized protein n=1 Tax=Canna indica TaxID=4628 RepID=A0AAQ3KCC9_9LILI|nr:hypothetical protein Cni_G14563 [Canna indica]
MEVRRGRARISFKSFEEWREEKWLEEGIGFDKKFAQYIIDFIAVSLWGLWKNKNESKFNGRSKCLSSISRNVSSVLTEYKREMNKREACSDLRPSKSVSPTNQVVSALKCSRVFYPIALEPSSPCGIDFSEDCNGGALTEEEIEDDASTPSPSSD